MRLVGVLFIKTNLHFIKDGITDDDDSSCSSVSKAELSSQPLSSDEVSEFVIRTVFNTVRSPRIKYDSIHD